MSALRSTCLRIGSALVALLVLVGCGGDRSDFPSWLYPHPPRVSTETGSNTSDMPAVYSDYGENVIVAWSSDPTSNPGYSDIEIYWRRYNALGVPQTAPIRITYNSYADYYPAIAMSDGVSYLVWMGDEVTSSNIHWAAIDLDGNLLYGPTLISDATYNDYDPHIIQCGNYSNVVWTGDSASFDYEIYYAKIRYNGIIDIPYRRVTNSVLPQDNPRIQVDWLCSELYVAYQTDVVHANSDIYVVSIDTSNGTTAHGPAAVATTPENEEQVQLWVNSGLYVPTRIGLVWRSDDGFGGEIYYASRLGDLIICSLATALTSDSQTDAQPAIRLLEWSNSRYALVAWERVESGTGTDRDIYLQMYEDDCIVTPSTPTLVSNGSTSASADDVLPSLVATSAFGGTPAYAVTWRTASDGAVWARFGAGGVLFGDAELISDSASAGYPAGDRPGAVTTQGDQVYVTWIGTNQGTDETWYQQSAWRGLLPVTTYNRNYDRVSPAGDP